MSEIDPVLQVNQRFYQAMSEMDMRRMNGVWLNEDWVRCVHPGWSPLEGWQAVQESWQRIFENTQQLHVTIGGVFVRMQGEMAWVSCVERVASAAEGRLDLAYVQATNLFVRRNSEWKMVLHHASHLPAEQGTQSDSEETVN